MFVSLVLAMHCYIIEEETFSILLILEQNNVALQMSQLHVRVTSTQMSVISAW